MKGWNVCRIGNVVDVQQGLCINSKSSYLLEKTGLPLLRITDMINNVEIQFINPYKVNKKFISKKTDLIFTRTGQVGLVFKDKVGIIHNNCFSIIPHAELNYVYLYYYLKQKVLYEYFNSVAGGSAQPDLNHQSFKSAPFHYPPLPIQRKIAAVLSAYDDLIENNNRRIAILEKMAEELYREWFVRLRFPGHENGKIVKGVPEGWEMKPIGEKFTTYLGGTPSRDNTTYWGGAIPWINSGEVNKIRIFTETEFISEIGYRKSATKKMPKYTTVLAITGATLGQVSFTEFVTCGNQSIVGIHDSEGLFNFYIFGYIKSIIKEIIVKQGGSGQQHINKDIIEKQEIIIPKKEIIMEYNKIVSPIDMMIMSLLSEIKIFTQTRDRLLSRLMSGKMDMENLDIEFPPSMKEEFAKG